MAIYPATERSEWASERLMREIERTPLAANVGALLDDAAERWRERPFLAFFDDDDTLSFADVARLVRDAAGALAAIGIGRGSRSSVFTSIRRRSRPRSITTTRTSSVASTWSTARSPIARRGSATGRRCGSTTGWECWRCRGVCGARSSRRGIRAMVASWAARVSVTWGRSSSWRGEMWTVEDAGRWLW